MKPPDSFIKYLQAHPAVWEALQEEKKNLGWHSGDWFILTHRGEQEINCVGTMAQDRDWLAWVKEAGKYRDILWLPDLGQLVRMIVDAGWSPTAFVHIPSEIPGEEQAIEEGWELTAVEIASLGATREIYEHSELGKEPEIACAALWAKVKGVE